MAQEKIEATVHLFCGLPTSGKTALAKELEQSHNAVRFTLDEWMIAITDLTIDDEEYGVMIAKLKEMFWQTAVAILQQGVDVILDWSLWNPERRQKWISRVNELGANYTLYYLNIPPVVIRQRIEARNNDLPRGAHWLSVDDLDRFLTIYQPPTAEENLNVVEMHLGQDGPIQNPHLEGNTFFWPGNEVGVLLLHGLTATTAEVRLLAEKLHAKGYTISAPLLPGHGTQPEDLNETTWHDWAWSAEKAYQHLATVCDHVFVGGESTGGALALLLAARHEEITGVLCYAPAIKLAIPMHNMVRLYVAAPLVHSLPKENVGSNANWQGYKVNPLRAVMELVRLGREVRRQLAQINQPVLVMQGRNDKTVAEDVGEIILEGVLSEKAKQIWLEQSAHVILLEDELDDITAVTLEFMHQALSSQRLAKE
ncbi:alpha/beta fold hydrolase [Candidatus Leptofilum sp.]|uniref:alpha/beta fold hydrolase n=1 Tax=Candidatus Leptofilum sp. TaxID=3241576 RepID=UPI003B597D08